jgi:hypothetical protein
MIEKIGNPVARAHVTWLSASAGGRTSGPPTAPVYAANCTFPLGSERETVPGWPATAEKFSVLIQKISDCPDGAWQCNLDFIAPDLVAAYLSQGASMLVMEGPKVVGEATIIEVFGASGLDSEPS